MISDPGINIDAEVIGIVSIVRVNGFFIFFGWFWMIVSFCKDFFPVDRGLAFEAAAIVIIKEISIVSIEPNCVLEVNEDIVELGSIRHGGFF